MKTGLLIIDLQQDFCPGGALAVNEGDKIIPLINQVAPEFDLVIATRDWHPSQHVSFASSHTGVDVQDSIEVNGIDQVLWPDHCVQGTDGAKFHVDLDLRPLDLIIHKGTNADLDSYSAFLENDHITPTGLEGYLRGLKVNELYICGLATDYCVYFSVLDALQLGFSVTLLEDCVRGVDHPTGNVSRRLSEMEEKGARLKKSGEI